MAHRISLPTVNDAHLESIKDEVWYEGWEWFNLVNKQGSPATFFDICDGDDEFEGFVEKAANMTQYQNDLWSNHHATDVIDKIPSFLKERFIENEVWEVSVDSNNVKAYNQAVSETAHDVEWALAENLIEHLKTI